MNRAYIGFNTVMELPDAPFIYIADEVPDLKDGIYFDPLKDTFNPLKDMTDKRAREMAEAIYSVYSGGSETLTVRNGRIDFVSALKDARKFDKIQGSEEVMRLVGDVLNSTVLKDILCSGKPSFPFHRKGPILVRLNRAELGDYVCLMLCALIISVYKYQVVIEDFGFYGRDVHSFLIRENRLIAGIKSLKDLPDKLSREVLSIKDKRLSGCLYDDAVLLAKMEGYKPGVNNFEAFIDEAMG